MKRILINSSYGDELRVALVDGAKLYDFDTESPEKTLLKGSIFKATVSRIESSLDAAFVNFGSERHGFLPLKDLSKDFYKKPFMKRCRNSSWIPAPEALREGILVDSYNLLNLFYKKLMCNKKVPKNRACTKNCFCTSWDRKSIQNQPKIHQKTVSKID